MLFIRKEQIEVFNRAATVQFMSRAAARIEQRYPEDHAALGSGGTLDLIRYTLQSGTAHGIRSESGLNGLLELYIEFGRDLELAPYRHWALRILAHPRLPGTLKVSQIRGRLFGLTQGRRVVRHTEGGPA